MEEALNHPWFAEFKDIHDLRKNAQNESSSQKFAAYTLMEPNSPKLKEEAEKYLKE